MNTDRAIIMRRAHAADLAAVLVLFEDARAWMISQGTNTWRPIAHWRDMIEQKIARRAVYLACFDGQVVGTITLEWAAEQLWDDAAAQAGYLAHFATCRARA